MKQTSMDFNSEIEEREAAEVVSTEPQVFSISDINRAVKDMLEGEFAHIWVKGEISNFKPHTSGHFYFSLKDDRAQISAVMFRGMNQKLKFKPTDGMEVIVRGKITVYEPRGNYQVFCETMEPVGAGALQIAFDQLKKKLALEGLFETSRKKPLPQFPQHVALVTSPTGAAVRDMVNVLNRRNKTLRVTVIPCVVQGDSAPASIVKALGLAQQLGDVDVIICGRGGGSIEDLWAFNTEPVARAIAACKIPTISAVGHEVDTTIADYVADLRAPTPSAAAELVAKNSSDLGDRLTQLRKQISQVMIMQLQVNRRRMEGLEKRLVDPARRLQDLSQRCDELMDRLQNSMKVYFQDQKQTLHRMTQVLDALSPLKVLDRGYAIVRKGQSVVREAKNVKPKDQIEIQIHKGLVKATVDSVDTGNERTK